ncbi:sigma-70 region 2 [Bacteriovorax sp. BAL6_X]|uniref:RNA polymerase sigma factor n=1 Tax=Bacteriovorax sp. BAL6_X TaxID=1201290 RepID=UPI000385A235|nr:RNA polymerase sigma factor [Bacteriovorax sp. BAL6_X]EPZ50100.1 sigma-70 region 2 [Bacteriovorax sp. BAL6_X]
MKNFIWSNSLSKLGSSDLMEVVAKNDDHQAFEALYQRLSSKLYQFVYYILLDEQKAQEIVHDAFLTLYDKRKMYRKEYQVSTWLWTIARNKSYDYLKKIKEQSIPDESVIVNIEDDQLSALEKLIDEVNSEVIIEAISILPSMQRQAITLWMHDCSGDEIAEILGKSRQAIKNLINRAKLRLKETLENKMESL